MAIIRIGEQEMACDTIYTDGERLTLHLDGEAQSLDEAAASFEGAQEIRVLNPDGTTRAIYRNHTLAALTVEIADGKRRVSVVMQVEPLEQGEADKLREVISLQAAQIAALTAQIADQQAHAAAATEETDVALLEVAGMAAEHQARMEETDAALIELAAMIAPTSGEAEHTNDAQLAQGEENNG